MGKHSSDPFLRASSDSTCKAERGPRVQLCYSGGAGLGPGLRPAGACGPTYMAEPSLRPAGACGPTFLSPPFHSVKDYGIPRRVACIRFPLRDPSLSPALPVPSSPRVRGYRRFVLGDLSGRVGSLRPPGDSQPWSCRESRMGPFHLTLRSREPDRAGAGPDQNQILALVVAAGSGPVIDPGLNGLAPRTHRSASHPPAVQRPGGFLPALTSPS